MFSKTRKRLTVYFTVLMMLFLVTFNGIGYFLLSSYVYSNEEKNILMLNEELSREQKNVLERGLKEKNKLSALAERIRESKAHAEHEEDEIKKQREERLRYFYVVLDSENRKISGELPQLEDPEELIQELSAWKPKEGDIRYLTFEHDGDTSINLVFTGKSITEDGRFLGTVYTGEDISQQKAVLRQLMSILIGLSGLFIIVSAFLGYMMSGRAMKPIVEAFERQRRFVSDASHELRTPLTVMHASLEVLESEEGSHMQPFSRQVLDDLKDETQRMSSLVSFLLTLAQGDASANQLALTTFSLRDELMKLVRKFKPLAEEKGLQLDLDISADIPVHADKERFLQLILILLDNALQYTPKDGRITLSAESDDRMLALSVADTGIGIPAELHEEIFERFYRGDPARSRGKGQLGLGLSIAKWIAEAHGGTIQVKSAPRQGSTFTVKLPIVTKTGL